MLDPRWEVTRISKDIEWNTRRPLPFQSIDFKELFNLEDQDFRVDVTFDRPCLARGLFPLVSWNTPREKRELRPDRLSCGSGDVSVSDRSCSDRACGI
jgi:hypothetical protein